jgi:hypothetical protein
MTTHHGRFIRHLASRAILIYPLAPLSIQDAITLSPIQRRSWRLHGTTPSDPGFLVCFMIHGIPPKARGRITWQPIFIYVHPVQPLAPSSIPDAVHSARRQSWRPTATANGFSHPTSSRLSCLLYGPWHVANDPTVELFGKRLLV